MSELKLKLKPDVKAKWLEALRSGEYRQGRSRLRTVDFPYDAEKNSSYCCLGVLCDLAGKEGVGQWSVAMDTTAEGGKRRLSFVVEDGRSHHETSEMHVGDKVYQTAYGVLPAAVIEWAFDIDADRPMKSEWCNPQVLAEDGSQVSLAVLNDAGEMGHNFATIADAIERSL